VTSVLLDTNEALTLRPNFCSHSPIRAQLPAIGGQRARIRENRRPRSEARRHRKRAKRDFGARQYDPRVGQWLSPDPILASYMRGGPNGGVYNPANLGLYGYCFNNPISYRDPNGESPILVAMAVGAVVGFGVEGIGQIVSGKFDGWRLLLAAGGGAVAGGLSVWSAGVLSFGAIGGGVVPLRTVGGVVATIGSCVAFNGAAGGAIGWYQEGLRQRLSGEKMDGEKMGQAAKLGAIAGAVGSAAGEFWALGKASQFNSLSPGWQNHLLGVGDTTKASMTEAGIAAHKAARVAFSEASTNLIGTSASALAGGGGDSQSSAIGSPGVGPGQGAGMASVSTAPTRRSYDQKLLRLVPREAIGN
jgi:RHS repeat-associated protein